MSFIPPQNWNRMSGFPKLDGNNQGATLVDKFYTEYNITSILLNMPIIDSYYDEENPMEQINTLRFSSYSIEPTETKNHAYITLTFQPFEIGGVGGALEEDGVASYFLENGTIDKPLETHPDYVVVWNHNLYVFVDVAEYDVENPTSPPAWANSATDQSDATGASIVDEFAWAKEKPAGGYVSGGKTYDWVKILDMTKPGVESYLLPSPVIQERKYWSQKKKAEAAGATVGTLVTPGEKFGITTGEWLVMSASMQLDGRKYLVERSFQYADDWDGDLYS